MRPRLFLVLAAVSLVAACTADDSEPSATSDDGAGSSTTVLTGPAPGVTDDAVKVGLLYVDTTALSTAGIDLDLGDVEGADHALVHDLNTSGGINGRQIDPVYTPVNPIGSEGAERACVEVAEDEQVFIAAGLFLADAVLCLVETHQTAVIGGEMTPERLERAAAPWFTTGAGPDLDVAVLEAMDAAGELEGPVAVLAGSAEEAEMTDVFLPLLDELGVDVIEQAVIDAPQDDPVATYAQVRTIAERFEAAGVESVIPLGGAGQTWPNAMADQPYRPRLVFPQTVGGVQAFLLDASQTDRSLLEGSIAGGSYAPDQAVYDEAGMQACIEVIEDAGVEVPGPDEVDGDATPWIAAFQACPTMALLRAVLEAAGDDLNYGTLQAAGEGLGELPIPGDPTPRQYGPVPATDGDPTPYLFTWDASAEEYVQLEG